MASTEQFTQAANEWDLETLYADLASAKGKRLTPVEKLHLRALLSGYSPTELAEKLNKSVKGVGVDLCNTLYQYVKNLVGKSDEKIENWRNIYEWLEEAGYKTQLAAECESSDCLAGKFLVKKANITVDKNQIIVDLHVRIVAVSPLETPTTTEEIDTNGKV
ncbi:helix-turn-helix domain-containing protein [Argonema antarcticum]|uniref:helix-turn-helix domain-containing protein n=1 Tax=Argonema antarcticum TaxID=2942763 RepID=UPI00201342A2|nr:helix-turn-helix domain-containing protein [Argonema antarcticum]MCL1470245.1 helix-turn-helix domain-containing protein [Argonema antarcticum A004/B2]